MKRILMMALVVLASASFAPVMAGDKNKKKKGKAPQPVALITAEDSLSYASGVRATEGLTHFLESNFGVDSTYMADFLRGYQDALAAQYDKAQNAYSAGVQIAHMVKNRIYPGAQKELKGMTDSVDAALFNRGFTDALAKDGSVMTFDDSKKLMNAAHHASVEKQKKANVDFLLANKLREGVVTLPSGLQYKVLREGHGDVPQVNDEVVVKYEGHLIDGTVFDSSYERNPQTNEFRPNQVIKGWTEALTLMPVGSMWELYIPQELGYGERQAGKIPPFSTLIFKVELEGINKK